MDIVFTVLAVSLVGMVFGLPGIAAILLGLAIQLAVVRLLTKGSH